MNGTALWLLAGAFMAGLYLYGLYLSRKNPSRLHRRERLSGPPETEGLFSCPATGVSFYTGFQLPGFASWIRGFAPCSRPASGRGRIPSGIPPPVHPTAFGSCHGAASAAGSSGLVVEEPGRRAVLLISCLYKII